MRYFIHLPPIERVVSVLERLFPLASSILAMFSLIYFSTTSSVSPQSKVDSIRVLMITLNLVLLFGGGIFALRAHLARFHLLRGGPFPLGSWQSQALAIVLVAILPTCALALSILISPSDGAFAVVFPISLLGVFMLLAAHLLMVARRHVLN